MSEYQDRDAAALGDHYARHVRAMTEEGLHSKASIAAELGWRDSEIARLRADLASAQGLRLGRGPTVETTIADIVTDALDRIASEPVLDADEKHGCPERSEANDCTLTYPHTSQECWCHESGCPRRPPPPMAPEVAEAWTAARVLRYLSWRLGCEAESAEARFMVCSECDKTPTEGCECLPF